MLASLVLGDKVETAVLVDMQIILLLRFEVWTGRIDDVLRDNPFVDRFLRITIRSRNIMPDVVGPELVKVLLNLSMCGGDGLIILIIFVVFDGTEA